MEDKVKERLAEFGLTEDLLTADELKQLKEEIQAEEKGFLTLDGVLSNPALWYSRQIANKNTKQGQK